MSSIALRRPLEAARPFIAEKLLLGLPLREYLRSLLTPLDLVAGVIIAIGIPLIAWRFLFGLASVTNLSQETPWGLWIGFDMLCGIALAAGGFTLATAVHVLGLHAYAPVVRPAILTGFLGYFFAVLGLLCDLGQPWRIPYPIVYKHGTTSVMFEVGWCVAVYLTVLFLEFFPAALEWLGLGRARQRLVQVGLGLTILGVVLSTLHQSSLGALFLMAPDKMHPLWYSPFLPIFFFVSAVTAGLSMVIVEGGLSHRVFQDRLDPYAHVDLDKLTLGLGRAASVLLFGYFFLRVQGLVDSGRFDLLATGYGAWYLFELLGLILLPTLLLALAARRGDARGVRFAAAIAVVGVVVGRVNVSIVAWNWQASDHYFPSLAEIWVSITLVTLGVQTFRFIVNRMPILAELPEYREHHS